MCRAYLTRLRSAFRLSQPLDALLRSHRYGLVSCRIRPWGFLPSEVSPSRAPPRLLYHRALPLLPFPAPRRERLQGLVRSGDPFASGRCYPYPNGRSSPDISPSQGVSPRVSALHHWRTSSHGLFTTLDHSIVVTALQSVKELKGKIKLFRDLSPSPG
jgi:hypothetical protein